MLSDLHMITISLAPQCRSFIWLMDHVVLFSFLSSFAITQWVLLWPGQSQAIAPHGQDLTICFTTHGPCASSIYHLYLRALISTPTKRRSFTPEFDLVHSALLFHLVPPHTFALLCTSASPRALAPFPTLHFTLPVIMLGTDPLPPNCTIRAT